jgi:hypothetical protein
MARIIINILAAEVKLLTSAVLVRFFAQEMTFDPWAPSSAIYGWHQDQPSAETKVKKKHSDRHEAAPIGGGSQETAIAWVAHDQKVNI